MKKRVKIEKGSTPGIDWVLEKITDLGYIPEELELEIEDWIGVVLEDKYVSYHEGGPHLGVTNISEIQVRYYSLPGIDWVLEKITDLGYIPNEQNTQESS